MWQSEAESDSAPCSPCRIDDKIQRADSFAVVAHAVQPNRFREESDVRERRAKIVRDARQEIFPHLRRGGLAADLNESAGEERATSHEKRERPRQRGCRHASRDECTGRTGVDLCMRDETVQDA